MDAALPLPKAPGGWRSVMISLVLLGGFVAVWHLATRQPTFDPHGMSPLQLQQMEFNGDIVRTDNGQYIYNPEKARGLPGPWAVVMTAVEELSSPGSALVAVVPAEMLLGELGVGYLTWIEWNNLHIAGILFAILVIGAVGVALDAGFNRLARLVTYPE
jgi:hypothetical protein